MESINYNLSVRLLALYENARLEGKS